MMHSPFARLLARTLLLLFVAGATAALQGCARPTSVNHNAFLTLREAGYTHAHEGNWAEAYAIALLLEDTGVDDSKVEALKSAALKKDIGLRNLESRRWLGGTNKALRTEKYPTPIITAILLYPVNLVGDLVDLVSFDFGVGIGLGAKVKATEVVALGAQCEMGEAVIGWRNGAPTAYRSMDNSLDLLTLEFRNGIYPADRMYEGAQIPFAVDGLKQPGRPPYDFATDYYGIGGHVMAGLVAVGAEFHPMQLLDAVAGLLFLDPLNDNWGVNESIELSEEEKDAARRLFFEPE